MLDAIVNIKIDDEYKTVLGIRIKGFTYDYSTIHDPTATLLKDAIDGIQAAKFILVEGSGIFLNETTEAFVIEEMTNRGDLADARLIIPGAGTFAFRMQMVNAEFISVVGKEARFNLSFCSTEIASMKIWR